MLRHQAECDGVCWGRAGGWFVRQRPGAPRSDGWGFAFQAPPCGRAHRRRRSVRRPPTPDESFSTCDARSHMTSELLDWRSRDVPGAKGGVIDECGGKPCHGSVHPPKGTRRRRCGHPSPPAAPSTPAPSRPCWPRCAAAATTLGDGPGRGRRHRSSGRASVATEMHCDDKAIAQPSEAPRGNAGCS
jgi:hypothetical protein